MPVQMQTTLAKNAQCAPRAGHLVASRARKLTSSPLRTVHLGSHNQYYDGPKTVAKALCVLRSRAVASHLVQRSHDVTQGAAVVGASVVDATHMRLIPDVTPPDCGLL